MVRLSADLILKSPQFSNTLKEREIDLRGAFPLPALCCVPACPLTAGLAMSVTHRPLTRFSHHCPGNKIPSIENLGATMDAFDTIDLSDNEIRKVSRQTLPPGHSVPLCRRSFSRRQTLLCLTRLPPTHAPRATTNSNAAIPRVLRTPRCVCPGGGVPAHEAPKDALPVQQPALQAS